MPLEEYKRTTKRYISYIYQLVKDLLLGLILSGDQLNKLISCRSGQRIFTLGISSKDAFFVGSEMDIWYSKSCPGNYKINVKLKQPFDELTNKPQPQQRPLANQL